MAEIINLRMARKAQKRAGKSAQAAANRLASGQTKQARSIARAENEQRETRLSGHRLEQD